jgi:DNA polymerase-3 subunit delta'
MGLGGVRGNRDTIARLEAELLTRPSHAYLLAGPRGVGKGLVARGFAHAILCERAPGAGFCCTPEACPVRMVPAVPARGGRSANRAVRGGSREAGEAAPRCECCAACVQVASGVHPDFTCLTRAQGRTEVLIEQVRELIARLGIRPSRAARRVAIVDDAETLGVAAQNALLKTLEEPPGHALIFMVSQSERALLDTVRSRLRLVRFTPLEVADIERILAARAGVEHERAAALARLARGSAGRALGLAAGGEPPIGELVDALAEGRRIEFARAQALAQEFFSSREQAAENFELIARVLEEILCLKLLRTPPAAAAPEVAQAMAKMADGFELDVLLSSLKGAVEAGAAVDAMANPRLQAEQWWMAHGAALRSQ